MRTFIVILLSVISFEAIGLEKITWSWLDQKEVELTKWAEKVGSENIVALGKTKQRPNELQVVEAFYPYLLPESYFGRSTKLSCLSEFEAFRKAKNAAAKSAWKECLQGIYRQDIPFLQSKALKEL